MFTIFCSKNVNGRQLSVGSNVNVRPIYKLLFKNVRCRYLCAQFDGHLNDFVSLAVVILSEKYKLWCPTLCTLLWAPFTSSISGPNIFLSTLNSQKRPRCLYEFLHLLPLSSSSSVTLQPLWALASIFGFVFSFST
jgi:hypothetical protein